MLAKSAFRCDLSIRLSPEALRSLDLLFARFGLDGAAVAATQRMRLTVSDRARRLDLESKTPFGEHVSLIARESGSYWVQHDAKVFVALDRALVPGKSAPTSARTEVQRPVQQQEGVGRGNLTAVLNRADSGQRLRITAEQNPDWRILDLARAALGALFGGLDGELPPGLDDEAWSAAFVERGFPSILRFEALNTPGEPTELLAETRITEFSAESVDERDFLPPADYQKWRLGTAGHERAREDHTAMPPHQFSASSNTGVSRPMRRDDDPGRESGRDPVERERPTQPARQGSITPLPPAYTVKPRIGLRIQQTLLTHLAALFNAAITPMRTVTIAQGQIVFDWLDQLRMGVATNGSAQAGTFVFELLHDVELPLHAATPPPAPADDFALFHCHGLLDVMAIRDAELRFRLGTYPGATVLGFAQSMRAVVAAAGTNWDHLPDGVKARLAFELVRREYGVRRIFFPTHTDPLEPVLGIINVRATNIAGTLTLPPLPPPAQAGDPPYNPLLHLRTGFGGTITGTLSLGTLDLTATVGRWPTPELAASLVLGPVAAFCLPGLEWTLPLLSELGLFLSSDIVNASFRAEGLTATIAVTFHQDARGIFVPGATCTLAGTASFGWTSVIPNGIQEILSAIERALLNSFNRDIMRGLAGRIADQVAQAATQFMGAGFPATAERLGLPISGGTRGGRAGSYTYLEAELDLSLDRRFTSTAVSAPTPLESAQNADAARAVPGMTADHYASLSFDENFLNAVLTGMRLRRLFDREWDVTGTNLVRPLMPSQLPKADIRRMSLVPEAGPTMNLVTNTAGQTGHGSVSLSYVLDLQKLDGTAVSRLCFRVDTAGQLVLASAAAPGESSGYIQIQTLPDRAFDLLLDLDGATITPASLDLITVQEVRTETIELDDRGKPHKDIDVEQVETVSPLPITAALTQALAPFLRRVLSDALWARTVKRAPRRDGIGGSGPTSADPITTLRYPFDNGDPDALDNNPNARVDIGLERRLAHLHVGHAGAMVAAALPIRTGSEVPMLALLSAVNGQSIRAHIVIKASTTSDRPLNL